MDHVVYLDFKAKELESLLSGKKTMLIRGAAGRKMPHGRVSAGDILFFINNNGEGIIRAKSRVKSVLNSEKLSESDSIQLVTDHQEKLLLTPEQRKRWAGKRYLVLIEIDECTPIESFPIDRSEYGNMDDWLPVGNIGKVIMT